jgi:hypothetical protein
MARRKSSTPRRGRGRSQKSEDLIEAAAAILEAIQPASVRAVCYQLFIQQRIPSMAKLATNRVSGLLARAREEGRIPWEWIVQEGRLIERVSTWADPEAYGRAVMHSYRRNKWAGQPSRVIVVSEKGTVRGTLEPVLHEFEVDFLPVGGYASATRVHELAGVVTATTPLRVFYLGGYDPSGLGMSEQDLPARLVRYAPSEVFWEYDHEGFRFRRLAVTEGDTHRLGLDLSFPARDKHKDTRYPWFVQQYGTRCWELDAMNPNDLRERVREAIVAELDQPAWDRYVAAEAVERASIVETMRTWNSISGLASE